MFGESGIATAEYGSDETNGEQFGNVAHHCLPELLLFLFYLIDVDAKFAYLALLMEQLSVRLGEPVTQK